MPNRYQREIEEILSRMEEDTPRRGLGDRIRPLRRPPERARSLPTLHIPFVNLMIIVSVILAMIAAGIAFYTGDADLISGIVGMVALVLFVVALVVGWRDRFRPPTKPVWRGASQSRVTPISRNPFRTLAMRFRIMRLRKQYRRAQEDQGDE